MQPLVSVLIPCFNAEHLVAQAIESALAQSGPVIEVIVVDDGSTDRSLDVIRRFDGRIRWEGGRNRGANAARNRLLELSRGDWLQYLDADDYLRPGKIARQLAVATEYPDCDVVYSPIACEQMQYGQLVVTDERIPEPRDPWILLAHWQLPQTGGSLWRKQALQRVGGWRVDQPCCQEHELYFRVLAANGKFQYCESCLAVYRFWDHGPRISNSVRDEAFRQRLLILDRIEAHLRQSNELTPARHDAINDTRHAAARMLWQRDRQWAAQVAESIRISDPRYYPSKQPVSPLMYSMAYRMLGFQAAEILASWKRAICSWAEFGVS
jgi:glycosyltransferase involved in cell wall biosynthesis